MRLSPCGGGVLYTLWLECAETSPVCPTYDVSAQRFPITREIPNNLLRLQPSVRKHAIASRIPDLMVQHSLPKERHMEFQSGNTVLLHRVNGALYLK